MFGKTLVLISLSGFIASVAFGVYTSNEHFNRMAVPDRPNYIYTMAEKKNGIVQVELLGETFNVDKVAIKNKASNYITLAQQKWEGLRNDPRLLTQVTGVKKIVLEQWELLNQSEKLRAVQQWVKESHWLKERI